MLQKTKNPVISFLFLFLSVSSSPLMGGTQSFIDSLFDSSTPVSDLKWDDAFRTPDVLAEISKNKSKITSALITSKVGWFFQMFSLDDKAQSLAATKTTYDILINVCVPLATTTDSVQNLGDAIN
jgi:hypothetical protein